MERRGESSNAVAGATREAAGHRVGALAEALGLEAVGDLDCVVRSAAAPEAAGADDLALAMDPKYVAALKDGEARAAVIPPDVDWASLGLRAALIAPRARAAMAGVTARFAPPLGAEPGVHPTAVVAPEARLGEGVSVGPFTVIEAGAEIGDRTILLGHGTVGRDARVGPDGLLHAGVRVGARVRIGARAIVHANAVIGSDGFSFVTPERGSVEAAKEEGKVAEGAENRVWMRIHSLGAVLIGDDVEIGANTTIDRGTVVDTRIGAGSKLDNQVQIGHNVRLGENCLLCGQVGVAGSSVIGDRVVLGGQSGVADHAKIGDDVVVMASSGVSGAVPSRRIVGGTPAIERSEIGKIVLATRRLPRLIEEVAALKKRFSSGERSG